MLEERSATRTNITKKILLSYEIRLGLDIENVITETPNGVDHLRPIILPHRFIVFDADPHTVIFRKFSFSEESDCSSFVQTCFAGFDLTPRTNRNAELRW